MAIANTRDPFTFTVEPAGSPLSVHIAAMREGARHFFAAGESVDIYLDNVARQHGRDAADSLKAAIKCLYTPVWAVYLDWQYKEGSYGLDTQDRGSLPYYQPQPPKHLPWPTKERDVPHYEDAYGGGLVPVGTTLEDMWAASYEASDEGAP